VVVVAFNNPEASAKMCERLKQLRPEIDFVAPPVASPTVIGLAPVGETRRNRSAHAVVDNISVDV
jgi:hypothetical protein